MTAGPAKSPGAWRLDRVALNVSDLDRSIRFYCEALGFALGAPPISDPTLAGLLGARTVHSALMRRGRQSLELTSCDPPGAPMPADSRSNDAWFQHCALVTGDIARDYARLRRFELHAISRAGPQKLMDDISAFKFRDPDGHPLELIAFPTPDPATLGGIDHAAISVADPARSIAFYAGRLGLAVAARQVNQGPAQDALDDLDQTVVDVVALAPSIAAPHVELLGYRSPVGRRSNTARLTDIASSRLVFAPVGDSHQPAVSTAPLGTGFELLKDPDSHIIVLAHDPWLPSV